MIKELVKKNRSYRRFYQNEQVDRETLKELVELAGLSPSASNLQPLKYILSCDAEKNSVIFPFLAWAGYLKDWPGPEEGERPSAYIVILGDTDIRNPFECDHGIAAQSMLLGAVEKGLGGCMLGSINRDGLRDALKITERFEILLVLAIGRPKEVVVLDAVDQSGGIKYWRDAEGKHHVPKRKLEDIIVDF
ncbi:MAG: nitroreductase family protein [Candidatus Omnitrophica bacterium]|nr:nitroreductase family protein [Candidatus Omnitrophota bacterium]